MWRQDTTAAAEPRAKLSRAGLRWALEGIVVQHLTMARVAEGLAVSWNTANNAVLAGGQRVLIADPAGSFEPLMLIPVVAAVLMAGRDVLTRMIAPQLPARAVALTSAIAVTVSGLLTWPLGDWVRPTAGDWAGIVICAGFVAAAHTLLVGAVRIGEMSFVAPFRYTSILLAVLVGYAVWGDVPGPMAILGGLVIVASGIVIFYRERRRMAQEEKASTT